MRIPCSHRTWHWPANFYKNHPYLRSKCTCIPAAWVDSWVLEWACQPFNLIMLAFVALEDKLKDVVYSVDIVHRISEVMSKSIKHIHCTGMCLLIDLGAKESMRLNPSITRPWTTWSHPHTLREDGQMAQLMPAKQRTLTISIVES